MCDSPCAVKGLDRGLFGAPGWIQVWSGSGFSLSDSWIGVDLALIWLLELQIYTQFELRLRRNRALRNQCTMQGQWVTLAALPLTRCLSNSVLAMESRTPAHPAAVVAAPAVAALHLHLLFWYCIAFLSCPAMDRYLSVRPPGPLKKLHRQQR